MEKIEKIGIVTGLITAIPTILSILIGAFLFLGNLDDKMQFVILLIFSALIATLNLNIFIYLRKLIFPSKMKVIRAFSEPDTYIFFRGEWRRIPDWQTRDYLASKLGFRPGEEDIEEVS